jgi:hypothetical protein
MNIGGKYNWRNQPERLVYLGRNWSGNGFWHQFAKVDSPAIVWCEVLDDDLPMIEETQPEPTYTACGGCGATKPSQRCIGCLHPFEGGEA